MVKNDEEGKAIALVGSWGSGKSTVIKIFEKKIGNDNKLAIFVFDTWAHQGDPLRRSFLERLMEFLKERKWIEEKTYEDLKERLNRSREEVVTKTKPILTFWGKLLALSLALTPLGSALSEIGGLWRLLGLPLLSLPPLTLFVAWVWNRRRGGIEGIEALFLQKTQEIQHSTAIRTPDPTSVEFSEMFVKVLDEGLKDESRRLVIVIDNLDRLSVDEARSIWGTMRTFLELEKRKGWAKRVWLIVPYDPSVLERLWGEGERDELPDAFASKTFQVTFHVPPPVLSDWGKFLEECLKRALPNHSDEERNLIKRLFRLRPKKTSKNLTPRDIKRFINRICALHKQWCGSVPLKFQVLYALYEDEINEEKLIEGKFTNQETFSKVLNVLGEDREEWRRYLAALYFNVPPERAIHVLIGNRVEGALSGGNKEELRKLTGIVGIWEVVEDVLDRMDLREHPEQIGLACLALSDAPDAPNRLFLHLSGMLLRSIRNWDKLDERSCEGLVTLSKRLEGERGEEIVGHLLDSLAKTKPPEETTVDWVKGVLKIVKRAKETGLEEKLKEFRVEGDASDYLRVLRALAMIIEDALPFSEYFAPKINGREVLQELSSKIISERTEKLGDMVRCLLKVPRFSELAEGEWRNLVEAIRQKLDNQQTQPEEVKELLEGLTIFIDSPSTFSVFQNLLNSLREGGRIFYHLYRAHSTQNHEAMAWCLIALLGEKLPHPPYLSDGYVPSYYPWNEAHSGFSLFRNDILLYPSNHPQVLEKFVHVCRRRILYRRDYFRYLVDLGSSVRSVEGWIRVTLTKAVENELWDFFPEEELVGCYPKLKRLLPAEEEKLRKLISASVKERGLVAALVGTEFDPQLSDLYLLVLESCPEEKKGDYLEYLRKGLRGMDEGEWLGQLLGLTPLIHLLLSLIEEREPLKLRQPFYDSLLEHAKKVLVGGAKVSEELEEKWCKLAEAIEPSLRDVFWKNLRDEFLKKSTEVGTTSYFLKIYGEGLMELGKLEEKADEIVRMVFREFLERRDEGEIEWMGEVVKKTKVLESASHASVEDLRQRVQSLLGEENISQRVREILREVLSEIAKQR